jgi:hypothetical protein
MAMTVMHSMSGAESASKISAAVHEPLAGSSALALGMANNAQHRQYAVSLKSDIDT